VNTNAARPTGLPSERSVAIRDSTLREGLDVPGVSYSLAQRHTLAMRLAAAGVPELEIVAPGKVEADLAFARELKEQAFNAKTTGLIYAMSPALETEIAGASGCLDWVDLLVSVSLLRKPYDPAEKWDRLGAALDMALSRMPGVGVGFPNATQGDPAFLLEMAARAVSHGAGRITLYDTNGSADPFTVRERIQALKAEVAVPVYFHGHNDLAMATANSLSAVMAGADGIDATVNGLGDRAGNCPLEPLAVALALRGIVTGIRLELLTGLSHAVAEASGIPLSRLAPVVGEFVFSHKSAGHLEVPELFEAFDPALVGAERKIIGK